MLSNMVMFIDLCTFSNDDCENNYNVIYPDEPKFKKENDDTCKAPFSDFLEVHDRI